jgi:uncharacterized protein YndB with AHSA1/START domain
MKLDLHLVGFYPHPLEKVWAAVSTREALAEWLMNNDFEPHPGARFRFWGEPTRPEWRGSIDCEVLAVEPPSRIVWSWRHSDDGYPTQVEIQLDAVPGGTQLKLRHSGEMSEELRNRYTSGWQRKLDVLRDQLSKADS